MFFISIYFTWSVTAIMLLTFATFVATGGVLSPRRVFTALSLVGALRIYFVIHVNRAIFTISEGLVAVGRVKVMVNLL